MIFYVGFATNVTYVFVHLRVHGHISVLLPFFVYTLLFPSPVAGLEW